MHKYNTCVLSVDNANFEVETNNPSDWLTFNVQVFFSSVGM